MPADMKMSKGAQLSICAQTDPEDPYVRRTPIVGCAYRIRAVTSSIANRRSEAAAILTRRGLPRCADGAWKAATRMTARTTGFMEGQFSMITVVFVNRL